ncbi:DUF3368 domain-containing protein [Vacuolonema iberomarrocanum]|uniref:DUF3368 domain-containing protein n=1 Tax=Vacuolonema iberomarrocanum TaxID=3454632 RepID=UPI0019DC6AAB|nr:DUF3368 domain-containing protein [filamentous cyanobacterium LEGE 07170]
MVIVSNTSPLSNLVIIGEVALLQEIYPKILIPPAVQAELVRLPVLRATILSLINTDWLQVHSPTPSDLLYSLNQTLDPGEAEAITLAVELRASRLLIDERLGRKVAAQYGLKLRGLVGLLIYAKQQGVIPALKPILDRLIEQAGFRVSQTLYKQALQEVGE